MTSRLKPFLSGIANRVGRFILPAVISASLILAMSVLIHKITLPGDIDAIKAAKISAEMNVRVIDPDKLIFDRGMATLMTGINGNGFEFMLISRENSYASGYIMIIYSLKGENKIHSISLPHTTYNNLETNYLLPKKIDFEVASEEFFKKNTRVAESSSGPRFSDMDWWRELITAFFIGCCIAVIWMIISPIVKQRKEESAFNGGRTQEITGGGIDPANIRGGMDDLIGLHDIKAEVLQIEDMIRNPTLYASHDISRPFNILMSGPAGTGKTKMASYLAKSLHIPMFSQPAGALETGLMGGGSDTLKNLYKEAGKHPMSIVFLDEGQVLLAKRGQEAGRKNADDTANTLLAILDGTSTVGASQVITIVASNFNDSSFEMDDAMLRRFPLKVDFRLPNLEERRDILKFYLDKKDPDCLDWDQINLSYLADITAGMSPALLNAVTDRASLIAIADGAKIDGDILFKAFERCSVGLTDRAKTAGRDEERRRIAIHELGHFFMQINPFIKMSLSWNEIKAKSRMLKISTEAIAKVNALGYVLSSTEDVGLKTLSQLENEVVELYGGAAAEEVFFGKRDISIGSSNDFDKATTILDTVVNRLSMYDSAKLNYKILKVSRGDSSLSLIEDKARELYASAVRDVSSYKPLILELTDILLEQYVLNKDQVFDWLEKKAPIQTQAEMSF